MLKWAVGFLILAVIAAPLGFTDIAVAAAGIAKILFGVCIVMFVLLVVAARVVAKRVM